MRGVSANPRSSHSFDIAVVGGGPAGSSAAISLAQTGMEVVLVEKYSLPRYKACGGGLLRRAIRLLPFNIDPVIECKCYVIKVNLLDANLRFSLERTEPIVTTTMRQHFDHFMVSTAQESGVEVWTGCEVLDLHTNSSHVELLTERGLLRAKFAIGADGAASLVARKAGWSKCSAFFRTLEFEVYVSESELSRFSGYARFDLGLVPGGYAWVFPKSDHLSIGIGSIHRGQLRLGQKLQEYFRIIGLERILKIDAHGSFIPVSPRKGSLSRKRTLLVGDAAGLANPLTGEGITFAILSGQLAARALTEGAFDQDLVRKVYDRTLTEEILKERRLSLFLSKLIYNRTEVRNVIFRMFGDKFIESVVQMIEGNTSPLLKILRIFAL